MDAEKFACLVEHDVDDFTASWKTLGGGMKRRCMKRQLTLAARDDTDQRIAVECPDDPFHEHPLVSPQLLQR